MIVPFLLFVMSGVALAAGLVVPGLSDLVLLAGPCVAASLILLVRGIKHKARNPNLPDAPPKDAPDRRETRVPGAAIGLRLPGYNPFRARPAKPKWILIDGSNVLYWKDNKPQLSTLRAVVEHLTALGFTPGVVFDANAGYLVAGKYQHHGAMGALLGLPEDRVMVVAKGEPADTVLLAAARDLGARIVTNDRYRDWSEVHPEVHKPGHLIRGGFGDAGLWLDIADATQG